MTSGDILLGRRTAGSSLAARPSVLKGADFSSIRYGTDPTGCSVRTDLDGALGSSMAQADTWLVEAELQCCSPGCSTAACQLLNQPLCTASAHVHQTELGSTLKLLKGG